LFVTALGLSIQGKPHNSYGVNIDNFGKVSNDYYRGAQPDQNGFAQLKRLGVKTVIDLQDDGKAEEASWVRSAGMQYVRIPLSSSNRAGDKATAYFLSIVNDPNNLPVYVHCTGGRHRTGEMTAIYRITHDGWTADQAFQEMKQYDWYSHFGHGPTRDYVFEYYSRYKNSVVGQNKPATNNSATANAAAQSAAGKPNN
jgi:protein tyrosine/serine phosphatase